MNINRSGSAAWSGGIKDGKGSISTESGIKVWIDETERRTWFLFESGRRLDSGGH
jgi:starvation-inducible DNA-binding protein